MALPKVGVQLIAEGAAKYFGDLERGEKAVSTFGASARTAVGAVNAFGSSTATGASKVAGFETATDRAARSSSKFGEVMTGAFREAGAMVTRFAADAGMAVVKFLTVDALSAASTFESTMSGIKAVLSPTAAEFEALGKKALDLGADTVFGASEAAEAIEMLAKNGLTASQILNGAADATVYLAAATGTDLSNAADIATDAMANFNIPAESMARAINGITGVTVASKFTIDDYRLAMAQAGGVAGSVGVEFEDFNTAIAAISPLFASGSDAGTSFKTFLQRLIPASTAAEAAMRDLGIITEEGQNQFFTASGALRDMDEIAGVLQGALSDLTEQQKNEALATIFGTDAMRAAVGLANVGQTEFQALARSIAMVDARQQAAERMNNFAGALEEAKGGLETMQIVIASKVLPFLTKLLRQAVIPAIDAITAFTAGVDTGGGALASFGAFIQSNAIPALFALGVAGLTYATTQLPIIIASVTAATTAFAANALAVAAAVAPFALVAGAVFAVAKAYQGFYDKVTAATDKLLESKPFWTDSAAAIDEFGNASTTTQEKLQPLVDSIEQHRQVLRDNIESLGARMAAGDVSEQQYQEEMAAINAQAAVITNATASLREMMQAEVEAQAAQVNATTATNDQAAALDQLPPKIQLSGEELQKLAKEFETIMERGSTALGTLATTHATFLSQIAEKQGEHEATIESLMAEREAASTADQKKNIDTRIAQEEEGYRQMLLNQAKAYAEQARQQRAALGEQLLNYIENQRQLGNITNEKSAEMNRVVIERFGVQRDSAAALFGEMAQIVDRAANDQIGSMNAFGDALVDVEDRAIDLREAAMALEDEYVLKAVDNFMEAGGNADTLRRELNNIPRTVDVTVNVTTVRRERDLRGDDPNPHAPGRALGGPVQAGQPYIVGERRPEVFVPEQDGRIIPSLAEFNRQYSPPSTPRTMPMVSNTTTTQGPTYQWTIVNPQADQVDSLRDLVRIQQVLYG